MKRQCPESPVQCPYSRPTQNLARPARLESEDVRARRLHNDLAHRLAVDILSGKYAPGDILPVEVHSREFYGVSRGVYREALRILAAKGMIDCRQRRGTVVKARAEWHLLDSDVLSWHLNAPPSRPLLRSLWELRLIIEPSCAELAASRRSESSLTKLRKAMALMAEELQCRRNGFGGQLLFHQAMFEAAENATLSALSRSLASVIALCNGVETASLEEELADHARYERVLGAIEARDGAAAKSHLRDSLMAHRQQMVAAPM